MLIKLFNDVFQFLKVRKKSLWSAFITHIFVTPNGSSEFLRFGNPLKPVGENPLIVIDHLKLFHVPELAQCVIISYKDVNCFVEYISNHV